MYYSECPCVYFIFFYRYVGRNSSSSTATGNKYVNLEEQAMLVDKAFE